MIHTPPDLIFEDPFLYIFIKPANIHTVIIKKSELPSIAEILLKSHPELATAGKTPEDAGILTRLDYETSGIIIVAKTRAIWEQMSELQAKSKILKEYFLIAEGHFPAKEKIETWNYSRYRSSKKVSLVPAFENAPARSQFAQTQFKLIRYFPEENLSLVSAEIFSGRRHQIRAHAAYCQHPLCGDALYGSKEILFTGSQLSASADLPKFALHCGKVEFPHPKTHKILEVKASLPQYFYKKLRITEN